jgi:hypothetical protein
MLSTTRGKSPRAAVSALVLASMLIVAAPAAADRYTAGSPGLGDELFPNAGNGGYDVTHYDLALDYDPVSDRVDGQAVITATATQDLDQFDLDLRDFATSSSSRSTGTRRVSRSRASRSS